MSVGDMHDVERTGEFAVTLLRQPRRRPDPANVGASGSVPITVLTDDATLADAIHDAAAAGHPVAVASTFEEALELAANGRCGILVTDQVSTQLTLRRMMQRLREAEPALVTIAVGCNNDQPGLISLLSAGVVDRLMLKPVTPSLAQIVLKSAVQQHKTLQGPGTSVSPDTSVTLLRPQAPQPEPAAVQVELQQHSANELTEARLELQPSPAEVVMPASMVVPAAPSRRIDIPRPSWIAVVAALFAVAGLMLWMGADRKPAIDAQAVIASNLAAAQRAFREGQTLEPRGRSAFDYYNTVLALDPANAAARQGIDQIADRFAAQAGNAIARGQVAAAILAVESIRRVRPEHRELAELQAQLDAAQEKYVAAVPERAEPAPPKEAPGSAVPAKLQQDVETRARAVAQAAEALKRDQLELASAQQRHAKGDLLQRVLQRTAENKLVEPADDSAKFHLQRLVQLDANFAGIPQGVAALGGRLTVNARLATAEKNFDVAASLLAQAREIGFSGTEIDAAEAKLEAARQPVAAPVADAPSPRLIRIVRPDYPQDALIAGAEGWVNVSMSVTPAGSVRDPRVEESSNGRLFDRAALAVVRKWKYEPFAAADPQATRRVTVRVDFRLKDRS
jgi:TonB family protein